jgi:hypothetical protein
MSVTATEEVTTMLTTIHSANLALRFCLEMALLAVVGLWAWRSFEGRLQVAATIGLPLVVMTIWGSVVHGAGVPGAVQFGTQVVLFAAAAVALVRIRHANLAALFGVAVVVNALLMAVWAQ